MDIYMKLILLMCTVLFSERLLKEHELLYEEDLDSEVSSEN